MTQQSPFGPLVEPLIAVERLLERFDDRGIVIGGVAVGILAKPRYTGDVDVVLMLSTDDVPELLAAAAAVGLEPRITNPVEFARRHRIVLLRHPETDIGVDISLGVLPFEIEAIERGTVHAVEGIQVRLPTPEDLIILKAVAHRPIDLVDIDAILRVHPDVNRNRIEY